ncbi:MAG: hypothetical protein K0Q54_1777 [Methylobacterium brachiatum]|nr:hypothetical protein [Methylobacterium brachiatum]
MFVAEGRGQRGPSAHNARYGLDDTDWMASTRCR